jgi:uncharacterized Zn-finger protein
MKLMVQRFSEEEILALTKPHSSQSHENHGENLKCVEFLQTHVNSHSTDGKIKCTFKSCALIFSSLEDLKEHKEMYFHAVEFSCDRCGKLFARKYSLYLHMQRHTQVRLHACDVPGCKYSAKVPKDLYQHKRSVHTSILHTCLLCGKNIKRLDKYKIHVARHKTETPGVFKCLYQNCKKLLESGDDLKKHTKEAHLHVKKPG